MSTKTQTDTNYSYDPTSLSTYHNLLGPMTGVISDYMKGPQGSKAFQDQLNMLQGQASNMGAIGGQNTARNLKAGGWMGTNLPGFMKSQAARQSRFGSALSYGAYTNALNQALQNQMWGTQAAAAFQPLQAGAGSTEKSGGGFSWLGPAIGAGLGMKG